MTITQLIEDCLNNPECFTSAEIEFVHTIDESEFVVNKTCKALNNIRGTDVFIVVPVMIEITEVTNE